MPPEAGKREDNSITARPCGTKKKIAANTHSVNVAGPAIAAVPRCRNPKTATRLNRIKSRSLSARTSWTGCVVVCVVSVVINLEKKWIRINMQGWAPFSLKGGKMNRFKLPGREEDWPGRAFQIEVYVAGSKITFSTS